VIGYGEDAGSDMGGSQESRRRLFNAASLEGWVLREALSWGPRSDGRAVIGRDRSVSIIVSLAGTLFAPAGSNREGYQLPQAIRVRRGGQRRSFVARNMSILVS